MSKNFYPQKVPLGSTIGVFASSDSISFLSTKRIDKGYSFFTSKGYRIKEAANCRLSYNDYLAGTIEDRVKGFHDLVRDKDVSALIAFWGGSNTNQIIPYLDYELIKRNPKTIIGYSDTCALLQAITNKTGLITYMGPSIITFTKPFDFVYSWDSLLEVAFNQKEQLEVKPSNQYINDLKYIDKGEIVEKKNEGFKVFKNGKAEGYVVASNLQTLLVLEGTEFKTDISDKILFIEEAEDAKVEMIDRYLTQLSQLENFNKIKGLVIGKFMEESGISELQLVNILKEITKDLSIPVIYNVDFGHSDPLCTIPNGGYSFITTDPVSIKFTKV